MKVIFGIGNPGEEYKLTRHNVGYEIIDRFVSMNNIKMKLKKNWLAGKGKKPSSLIIKPLSFVNECGRVAKDVISTYEVELSDFLVVVDDFALPLGTLRMRLKGSSGGHKGLKSIIYHLESEEFPRLRIGIGPRVGESADFVLSKFKKSELEILDNFDVIEQAIQGIQVFLADGITRAMEVCNKS
ncbi:aminoacyl-tRNA hydrolase [candidate division WOR-3 bacterium]|nr:aminoacyl-tRNA hydrolase [candidate division WOR-3 bacterium]